MRRLNFPDEAKGTAIHTARLFAPINTRLLPHAKSLLVYLKVPRRGDSGTETGNSTIGADLPKLSSRQFTVDEAHA